MKKQSRNIKVLVSVVLILALGISMVHVGRLEASSRLSKPKISLQKRTKKTATIKLKGGNVTGYRIYMKSGKKGKWQLQALVMRGVKGNIKGKLATFSLSSNTLKLSKLKPKKVYYIKVKTWKSSWKRYGHIKRSPYSKVLKIGKYKKKPVPTPTGANTTSGDAAQVPGATSGDAVQVPEESPNPSAEVPSAE